MRFPYLFLMISVLLVVLSQSGEASYDLTAQTDDNYTHGDVITINVSVTEQSIVTVQVINPYEKIILVESIVLTVDFDSIHLRVMENKSYGRYTYFVSAKSYENGERAIIQGNFSIVKGEENDSDGFVIPLPFMAAAVVAICSIGILRYSEKGRLLWFQLFFVPLYTRMKSNLEDDINQQTYRGRIYQHIKERPGTSLTYVKSAVEIGTGTTVYHLKVLEREGKVIRRGMQYYVKGANPQLYGSMSRPLNERESVILEHLLMNSMISEKAFSTSLNMKPSTIHRNLKVLIRFGLVQRVKINGRYQYSVTTDYYNWLAKQDEL